MVWCSLKLHWTMTRWPGESSRLSSPSWHRESPHEIRGPLLAEMAGAWVGLRCLKLEKLWTLWITSRANCFLWESFFKYGLRCLKSTASCFLRVNFHSFPETFLHPMLDGGNGKWTPKYKTFVLDNVLPYLVRYQFAREWLFWICVSQTICRTIS